MLQLDHIRECVHAGRRAVRIVRGDLPTWANPWEVSIAFHTQGHVFVTSLLPVIFPEAEYPAKLTFAVIIRLDQMANTNILLEASAAPLVCVSDKVGAVLKAKFLHHLVNLQLKFPRKRVHMSAGIL